MHVKQTPRISLDDRLFLPADTAAILWDLDGTLVDSLQLDLLVCAGILSRHAGRSIVIPEPLMREGFALSGSDFWRFLFQSLNVDAPVHALEAAHAEWLAQRLEQAFPVHEGVREVLDAARAAGLKQAVVSNNPQDEVVQILANSRLLDRFDVVAGNDGSGRAKKPAPTATSTRPARSGSTPPSARRWKTPSSACARPAPPAPMSSPSPPAQSSSRRSSPPGWPMPAMRASHAQLRRRDKRSALHRSRHDAWTHLTGGADGIGQSAGDRRPAGTLA
jgi:phosphoglycolate phosphatase-like HAD superfamily hydrolase